MEQLNTDLRTIVYDYLGDSAQICNIHLPTIQSKPIIALFEASIVGCRLTFGLYRDHIKDINICDVLEIASNIVLHDSTELMSYIENMISWNRSSWEVLVRFAIRHRRVGSLWLLFIWRTDYICTVDHALYAVECDAAECLMIMRQDTSNFPLCMIRAAMFDSIDCIHAIHKIIPQSVYENCSFAAKINRILKL